MAQKSLAIAAGLGVDRKSMRCVDTSILGKRLKRFKWIVSACAWLSALWAGHGTELEIGTEGDRVVLNSKALDDLSGSTLQIERSGDLSHWESFATVRERLLPYPLDDEAGVGRNFFRLITRPVNADDDWANQLDLSSDLFFASGPGSGSGYSTFSKFTLILNDLSRVYFQDSNVYPFHFHFAHARLPGYQGIDFFDYQRIALRTEGQELALGSVIKAPDESIREVGIQFAGSEAFPVEQVGRWYHAASRRIAASGASWRMFYMPTLEQLDETFQNLEFFEGQGIPVAMPSRWVTQTVCYSSSWTLGRLVWVPGSEIGAAYGDGRLMASDVLVTDHLPAELPIVAGVITFSPATPNSHVVLLAQSQNLPIAFASGEGLQDEVRSLFGEEVLYQVSGEGGECRIQIESVGGKLSDEEREAILEQLRPPTLVIQPKGSAGAFWLGTEELEPGDIRFVGGKAANFGFLRREIPEQSPNSIAFTFDLWDRFMGQDAGDSQTLEEWIENTLSPFRQYPPDIAGLRPALRLVQDQIKFESDFDPETKTELLEVLSRFSADRKIRFRSSTNVEDSDEFIGAGLYDSFSGCVLDDRDTDERGPSHCDSSKSNERGVFRAIRKVYASFYNENAYLERLRHGLNESEAAMGVLVHHSFPDESELANGVATFEIASNENGGVDTRAIVVTQKGAASVSNPDSLIRPEVVTVASEQVVLEERSSLVDQDETVFDGDSEYQDLFELLNKVAMAFRQSSGESDGLVLDFEFKKMAGEGLIVKQVRAIPQRELPDPPVID